MNRDFLKLQEGILDVKYFIQKINNPSKNDKTSNKL
jgi:hypothetical protein